MKDLIVDSIQKSIAAQQQLLLPANLAFVQSFAKLLALCFQRGNHVLCAGNGGSMCDAMHFAEELTGIFRKKRTALPAIVLSDVGHLTCVGNDLGYAEVFARGIEAHGREGDVFIGLTTSGNSPNLIRAFEVAKERGLQTVALLGKTGGALKGVADLELVITDCTTSDRIQEAHMTSLHVVIEIMEYYLFGSLESKVFTPHAEWKQALL